MISKINGIRHLIGNTPLKKLYLNGINASTKLEYNNFSGSIKDRAAFNILYEGIKDGILHENSYVVESSSGNFAIALMSMCQKLGLKFTAVVDPNINKGYESLLKLGCDVQMVNEMDYTGGYLLNRIERVKQICEKDSRAFWPNQYANPNNYLGYYHSLGNEICESFDKLDYIFIAVSSGGTITGTAKRVKEKFPHIKVVAVDIEGSVVFGAAPKKRYVSGLGASKVPAILDRSLIDDVVHVTHMELIRGCRELLKEQSVFAGASSGASYFALKNYKKYDHPAPNALFLCTDKGYTYMDTVYDDMWVNNLQKLFNEEFKVHH